MKSLEAQVQKRVVATYKAAGGAVCSFSQGFRPGGKRHGTTRQTKGIPDLLVFLPRRRLAFFQEVKAPDQVRQLLLPAVERMTIYRRKQTREQHLFEQFCGECRVHYVLGGVEEAESFLQTLGIILPGYPRIG